MSHAAICTATAVERICLLRQTSLVALGLTLVELSDQSFQTKVGRRELAVAACIAPTVRKLPQIAVVAVARE